MHWMNYHHLLYFWATAKHGSITAACDELHLTPQTISAQIRTLEKAAGVDLFLRRGRRLELTDMGQVVYRYATDIFSLGRELADVLRGHHAPALTLRVGMADALPKLIAHHVLAPALSLEQPVRIVCREGKPEDLLTQLATHDLDVVLNDSPLPRGLEVKAFNHLLGESGVTFVAAPPLAKRLRRRFPRSLDGAPLLLPTSDSALRASLDRWLDEQDVHPMVVGEFGDSAVLKVFGQHGSGALAVPSVVEGEVRRQYKLHKVGDVPELVERFYAISVERKVRHPAVMAIYEAARGKLFA
jgi:LysR family transcriptional regulator, transcriptional activator of nhaA